MLEKNYGGVVVIDKRLGDAKKRYGWRVSVCEKNSSRIEYNVRVSIKYICWRISFVSITFRDLLC